MHLLNSFSDFYGIFLGQIKSVKIPMPIDRDENHYEIHPVANKQKKENLSDEVNYYDSASGIKYFKKLNSVPVALPSSISFDNISFFLSIGSIAVHIRG